MNDIKEKIDRELWHITAEDKNFQEILRRAEMEGRSDPPARKKRKYGLKVAVLVAAITILSTGSVFGYEYIRSRFNPPAVFNNPLDNAQPDAPVFEFEDKTGVEKNAPVLTVEWNKYTVDEHHAYFDITVKSKDGSPIMEETDLKAAFTNTLAFDRVSITLDGITKMYSGSSGSTAVINGENSTGSSCWMRCVGHSEDFSSLDMVIEYTNYDVCLPGKEIMLKLENIRGEYMYVESIGTDKTLGELLENGIPAQSSDFVPCDTEEIESGGYTYNVDFNYELKQGKNQIYFSNQYPQCYIDNYGFAERKTDGAMSFFMTVVCDETSKAELKQMCFQSTISGWGMTDFVKELEDGRLQFQYNVNNDLAYWDIHDGGIKHIDTTMEHINTLLLRKNFLRKEELITEGNWENKLLLDGDVLAISNTVDVVIPAYNNPENSFTATSITIDTMKIKIDGVMNDGFDFKYFGFQGERTPVVILKDGTRLQADAKGPDGGAMSNDNTKEVHMCFYVDSVINPKNVESIEFHGVTIWRAE